MAKPLEYEIKRIYASLRKSEQKAADYYLGYDGPVETMSIAAMARAAGVSQPTVMRFVKALGLEGFKEFKYQVLKASLGGNGSGTGEEAGGRSGDVLRYGYEISARDRPEEVPGRVVAQSVSYLDDALKHISPSSIGRAAGLICGARQIAVYYVENSASVAGDLATKLMYLGFNCIMYNDIYLQHISAGNLDSRDVAIGISYSGSSKNTVDVMKLAKKKGAATIAITNFEHSLIAGHADILLCTSSQQLLYGNAIFSRMSQTAVVDMIYMGIILRDYGHFTGKLDESSRIIRRHAY